MKKSYEKILRRLICYGLTLTMVLTPAFSVFADDDTPEDQRSEVRISTEADAPDTSQSSPETPSETSPEPAAEAYPGSATEASPEPASEESVTHASESTPETTPQQNTNETESKETEAVSVETASEASPEPASEESVTHVSESTPETAPQQNTNETESKETEAVSVETAALMQTAGYSAAVSGKALAAAENSSDINTARKSSSSGPIHVGDTSFNYEDDESSHWSEGKGWKNVAGKYIAMVDYDGREAEISSDGDEVTLAVAGVNRIGKLTGNCSYQISGTGIVLIDSIEIENGNTVTLHPNSALYDEGSAAVFLKQDDGSYMLINGEITGILDEVYELDDLDLVVPDGSSLTISAAAVRTETWDDEYGTDEDITFYLTDLPYDVKDPVHDNGRVEIEEYIGSVVIGNNSTLTIDKGASVHMNKLKIGFESIEAELIVQGTLNVLGVLEGGFTDINNDGSVTGNGTILSAELDLDPEGTVSSDLLLDNSGLTINGNRTITPPMLKDSIIYLKGTDITIPELNASGVSRIGVDTIEDLLYLNRYKVGNIAISTGGRLEIVCNDHPYASHIEEYSRYVEDSCLEISGKITGGPVHVLGGSVRYTGNQKDILPVVPDAYASRVLITGINTNSSLFPLNMTANKASELAKSDEIPFTRLTVRDSLISENVMGRAWVVSDINPLNPISRKDNQEFTCASFLKYYGMTGESSYLTHFTAVEVIRSDLTRERFFLSDRAVFTLDDVIMVRVLDCIGQGGQGGSSVTHTNASFTGNGVIGGPGSGSVKAGKGTVVFGKASYIEPVPTPSPEPDNDNTDNENTSSNSNNKDDNSNTTSSNTEESNSNITPSDNEKNGSNTTPSDNEENGSITAGTDTGKTPVSSFYTGRLVVTVSPVEQNSADQNKADPKLPQVWHLDVTNAGVPVTDLSGNPIRVVFPFTVPEYWGDPARIANDRLYAVFTDEAGNLTAYNAEYDPETGEISFESEQTGEFVIVRFAYEDEPFTEDFYHALAELEEIQLFLAALRD